MPPNETKNKIITIGKSLLVTVIVLLVVESLILSFFVIPTNNDVFMRFSNYLLVVYVGPCIAIFSGLMYLLFKVIKSTWR